MSERLTQILQAVDDKASTLDKPRVVIDVPGLTEEEANVVAKIYSDRFRVLGPTMDNSGYAVHIGYRGELSNA